MKLWLKLSLAAVAVLTLTAATFAAGAAAATRAANHPGGPLARLLGARLEKLQALKADLNLTDDQKQDLHKIIASHREEIAAALKPVVADRRALREAVSTGDEKSIRAAADTLAHDLGDAAVLASKLRAEIVKILTPDQLDKLKTFRASADSSVDTFLDNLSKNSAADL